MGDVIGELLPLALGVAISPVPIIAVVLMLLAPRAGGTSTAFLCGWFSGILIATVLFAVIAAAVGFEAGRGPTAAASWLKVALGAVLLLLAGKQWRNRPGDGETPTLPGWMTAVDSFGLGKAGGLGALLAAGNPKNLALVVTAGVTIGSGGLSVAGAAAGIVGFTVLAAATVALPVLAYAVAKDRMATPLDALRRWLVRDNATIMTVLLGLLGSVVLGNGIAGLA